jgi:hypothetical protein
MPKGIRDPSSHRTPAQIRKQVKGYNHRPEQIKERSDNNKARAMLAKEGLVHKGDNLDVDHKKPQRSGGSNKRSNLRAIDRSRNRGWRDGI